MTITLTEIVNKVHASQLANKQASLEALFDVNVKPSNESAATILAGAQAAGKIASAANDALGGVFNTETSLSEYTRTANVEPRVMLEDTLRNLPGLEKFFMTLTNIYTAYYLQAVALSAEINGVSVISRLDRFNPNRNVTAKLGDAAVRGKNVATAAANAILAAISKESELSYGFKLPNYKLDNQIFFKAPAIAVEASKTVISRTYKDENGAKVTETTTKEEEKREKPTPEQLVKANSVSVSSGLKQIADLDTLAVGRLIEVDIIINGTNFKVPVAVRIRPMSVPSLIMRELVALGDIRESFKERWHRMRAGELNLVSDWIFQSDRIRKLRKLMKLDKQGLYREMLERRKNNKIAAAATGHVSIGAASSFMIITKETAKEVEYRSGMPISNEDFRQRVFAENSAMMIIVVDTEWEQFQCYTRGIRGVAEYSFKQFENMSKGNGPNIMDIMKAYTLGNNPRF